MCFCVCSCASVPVCVCVCVRVGVCAKPTGGKAVTGGSGSVVSND